jgi:hypothetical protein
MKKQYLKPTTRVVMLKQRYRILSGSPVARSLNGAPEGIGWAENGIGEDEVLR